MEQNGVQAINNINDNKVKIETEEPGEFLFQILERCFL